MRNGLKKCERRKAISVAIESASKSSMGGAKKLVRGYIGNGAYNYVYAVTADLVVRVEEEHHPWDTSWRMYEIAQLDPHPNLPVVWEIGSLQCGRRYAIVERMECALVEVEYWSDKSVDELDYGIREVTAEARRHLRKYARVVSDLHEGNVMLRRKTHDAVLTDCLIYD